MGFHTSKGSIAIDLMLVMLLFTTIFSIIVISTFSINSRLQTAIEDSGSGINTTPMNQTRDALLIFDSGIPFIFFGFVVVAILSAVYLKTSPVISIFLIIVVAVIGYVAQALNNGWFMFATNNEMVTAANEFPMVATLMEQMPLFIIIIGMAILIFYFAKPKQFAV